MLTVRVLVDGHVQKIRIECTLEEARRLVNSTYDMGVYECAGNRIYL